MLTVENINIVVVWHVTTCILVCRYQLFSEKLVTASIIRLEEWDEMGEVD